MTSNTLLVPKSSSPPPIAPEPPTAPETDPVTPTATTPVPDPVAPTAMTSAPDRPTPSRRRIAVLIGSAMVATLLWAGVARCGNDGPTLLGTPGTDRAVTSVDQTGKSTRANSTDNIPTSDQGRPAVGRADGLEPIAATDPNLVVDAGVRWIMLLPEPEIRCLAAEAKGGLTAGEMAMLVQGDPNVGVRRAVATALRTCVSSTTTAGVITQWLQARGLAPAAGRCIADRLARDVSLADLYDGTYNPASLDDDIERATPACTPTVTATGRAQTLTAPGRDQP